jgi:N-carbamoylputrescine amidase
VKRVVAAIQMAAEPGRVAANLERADWLLREAHRAGATLAVLPEMFNTGYGLLPDYAPCAEGRDGPTVAHLLGRAREWDMAIAAGFVERDGHHLYDSLAYCQPDGQVHVYRKRNLVFWERFRFRPGRAPVIVATPFGRIGFAICADMIYRRVWDAYRGRIDLAIVAAAWPDFACRHTGRKHWLLGRIGPLSAEIPGAVATDLGVPVLFANQCGPTRTTIPLLGTWLADRIADRFAGCSCVCDGRHGPPVRAGGDDRVVLASITLHPHMGPISCRSTSRSEGSAVPSSASAWS